MVLYKSESILKRYGCGIPMMYQKCHAEFPSTRNHVSTTSTSSTISKIPLPIKAAKAADLRKLATEYLPNTAKGVYIDLPAVADETDSDICITLFCLL